MTGKLEQTPEPASHFPDQIPWAVKLEFGLLYRGRLARATERLNLAFEERLQELLQGFLAPRYASRVSRIFRQRRDGRRLVDVRDLHSGMWNLRNPFSSGTVDQSGVARDTQGVVAHSRREILREICGTFITFFVEFQTANKNFSRKCGAGEGTRTRNFQLGKLNFRSFILKTTNSLKNKVRTCAAYCARVARFAYRSETSGGCHLI